MVIPWSKFEGLWAVLVVSAAAGLTGLLLQKRPYIAPAADVLAGPILFIIAAVLVMGAARGVRGSLAALILFTAADLGYYGMSYSIYKQTDRLEHVARTATMPPADLGGRVYAPPQQFADGCRLWTGNQMILAGWHRTCGYAGLEPQRKLDYADLPALQASDTCWVERDPATAQIAGLMPCGTEWLQVPGPLPRVRLVTRAVPSQDPAQTFAKSTCNPDPR